MKDYAKPSSKKYEVLQRRFEEALREYNKKHPTLNHLKLFKEGQYST